jgi:hypothetical protein
MAQVIYEFELPDGSILEIEGDEGKQAEATAKAKEYIAAQQPTPLSRKERAEDYLRSAAGGGYMGLSYIPGAAGDIEQLGKAIPGRFGKFLTTPIRELVTGKKTEPAKIFPTSAEVREKVEEFVPGLKEVGEYDPQTTMGGYLKTIPEFAAPGILGKTKQARKFGLGLGAASGGVYETVESATGSPLTATGITLPFAIATGKLFGPSTAAGLSEKSLKGIDKAELDEAIKLENLAKTEGIKLLPGETLDNKLVNQLTQDVLRSEKGGPYIYESIKGRPVDALNLATSKAAKIADIPESQRRVLESIQKTAKSAITSSEKRRSQEAFNQGYRLSNVETIAPGQVLNIIKNIDNLIADSSPNSLNQRKLKQIRKELIVKEGIDDGVKYTVPVTNINKLDSTFKTYRDAVQDSRKNVADPRRFVQKDLGAKLFNSDGSGALDVLKSQLNTNTNYRKANQVYEDLTKNVVNIIKDNTGTLAKEGIDLNTIEKFIFNSAKADSVDINNTLKTLNAVNPEATKQIANLYFRNAINNAFPIVKQGEDLSQGFKLIESIAKTGKQRNNFLTVIDNVADAHGVNRKDFKVGFENMINILDRTGRISNINKPGFDVQGIAARTLAKDLAMMKTFNPLVRLATKYGEFKSARAMGELGKIMANDDAVATLVMLGKTNPQSKQAIQYTLNIINSVSPTTERLQRQEYLQSLSQPQPLLE